MSSKLIFFVIAIISVQYVHSIDYKSAMEKTCTKISTRAKIDPTWMMSVEKWHYLHMNRFDLYSTAIDLTKKHPKDLTEDEIYYKSCIHWSINPGSDSSYTVYGFGNRESVFKMKPLENDFGSFEVSTDEGVFGTAHVTLTDNKSFMFSVLCFKDSNQLAWGVGSPFESLPKATIKKIHDHAESLGFKREHFTSLRYDSACNKDEDDTRNEL